MATDDDEATPTRAELLAMIAQQGKQVDTLLDAVGRLLKQTGETSPLPSSVQSSSLDTMSSALVTEALPIGRPFEVKHPLPTRIKALKIKTADLAEQLSKVLRKSVARTTVRSWYLPRGHRDARAIPEAAVKFFEAEPWDIPRSAWKNGFTDSD